MKFNFVSFLFLKACEPLWGFLGFLNAKVIPVEAVKLFNP